MPREAADAPVPPETDPADAPGAQAAPAPPLAAEALFGTALPTVRRFAELLAGAGVERGLIGPREVDRLWERHLMNCAALAELVPQGAAVVDVGSGAGLPGLVLAACRPDVRVTLLEPLLRRTVFLGEAVETLNLANARVERGRAEDYAGRMTADVVTARAVAPMERLVGWCLPLLRPGGVMLALKGDAASDELSGVASGLAALGAAAWSVVEVGSALGAAATRVVRIELGPGGYKAPRSADRRARSAYRPGRRTRG